MDNIPYPRQLNRPSYIVWRFTFSDVKGAGFVFLGATAPTIISTTIYPGWVAFAVTALFLAYRGCVLALKPRGWDVHVITTLLQPKEMVPGHVAPQCIILEHIPKRKKLGQRYKNQ